MRSAVYLAPVAAVAVMLACACPVLCPAQDQSTPPPPAPPPPAATAPEAGQDRPDKPDKPPREDGGDRDRRPYGQGQGPGQRQPGPGGFGNGGSGGGMPRGDHDRDHDRERGDMFKNLPEGERQRVREAFEKAWADPEVIAARDRLNKANEEFRNTLHSALKKVDPEVVEILERVRPPGGFPGARMPEVNDPEFARQAVARMGGELQMWARMERREGPMGEMHDRIIRTPAVQEAIQRMETAPVDQRPESWRRLREAYLAAAKAEFIQAWGKSPWDPGRERDRDRGDGRGPGPGRDGAPSFGSGSGGPPGERGERPPPQPRPEGEAPRAPEQAQPKAQ